jgi:hypothetical protein
MSSSFKFNVPGLNQTTTEVRALNSAIGDLKNTLREMSGQQASLMQGMNGVLSGISSGASSGAAAINMGGGRGGGGSTPTGIPYAFSGSGGGSNAFEAMSASLSTDSNMGAMLTKALSAPTRYAYNRFEETRANAPMIASALGPVATMNNTTIVDLIQRLQEGTPVKGSLGNVLGALNQGALMGYGDLGSARGGAYFEGIRQMQSFTPGVGAADLGQMQNSWLGNTGGHQRAMMLTGGAMSGFGAGAVPKTLQEWAESTLKWFEGQRPGAQRGKKFTKEELATQQFPGSNMDAWFTATQVPEYMRQYFWQYVIGSASTGSTDVGTIVAARGQDVAFERLRTQTAQGRREFQVLGSGTNYEDFANREGNDRRFEEAMGRVDQMMGKIMGSILGPIMSMMPTPVANLAATMGLDILPNIVSSGTSLLLGDPQRKRRAPIGDTYGAYGGQGTSHMDPSFARKVEAMMEANPNLQINSGFRDGALQGRLHAAGVGQVAPAGQSMHGRGLAADLGPESEFGWIAANASRFGLDSGVGFGEPWHVGAPGTVPVGDIWSDMAGGAGAMGIPVVGPMIGLGAQLMGGAAQSVGINVPGDIGGLVELMKSFVGSARGVFDTIGNGIQGIAGAMSGDFSSLFGSDGLFSPVGLINKASSGIEKLTGLPTSALTGKGGLDAIVGWLTGSSGINNPSQKSSIDWQEARKPIGGGLTDMAPIFGTAGSGPVGQASVSRILQKYGGGASTPGASVRGQENSILQALQAAQAAGFSGDELIAITSIAGRESRWNPRAFNGNAKTGDESYGLYQINMMGSLGPARRRQFGISRNDELFDPRVSGRAAFSVSGGGQNFNAWGAYKGKSNLYNATQWVEPVYNIAKQHGFVGDPRRRSAVGDPAAAAQYSPQMAGAGSTMTYAPHTMSQVVSSPVTIQNHWTLQVAGNDVDARRLAAVVMDQMDQQINDASYREN